MIERRSAKIGRPEFSAPVYKLQQRKMQKENARERLRTYKLNHLRNERQPLSPLGQDATVKTRV